MAEWFNLLELNGESYLFFEVWETCERKGGVKNWRVLRKCVEGVLAWSYGSGIFFSEFWFFGFGGEEGEERGGKREIFG